MFARNIRRLNMWFLALAIIGWGLFALAFAVDYQSIPPPLIWLGAAIGAATTLAAAVFIWVRARMRK